MNVWCGEKKNKKKQTPPQWAVFANDLASYADN